MCVFYLYLSKNVFEYHIGYTKTNCTHTQMFDKRKIERFVFSKSMTCRLNIYVIYFSKYCLPIHTLKYDGGIRSCSPFL